MSTKREKSAGAIVYKRKGDSKPLFLVVRDSAHGNWGFPKGHVDEGESERETAVREIYEEVALEVKLEKGFREEINYELKDGTTKTVVYFLAEAKTEELDYSNCNEIDDHRWMSMYEAIGRVTFVNAALIVQKAKQFLDGEA